MEQSLGLREVLEPVLADVLHLDGLTDQRARGQGEQDLPTSRSRCDPCRPMELEPDVPDVAALDVTAVQSHPHA
jgi:hypothetical protein